jgi:flagellin-like hook-associated protein FlgL
MSGITLSAAVRQNLLALQNTADLMSQTQNRLATGKKVNSALDNPGAFFTASGLDNRASDLSGLLDDMGQSIQALKAADQGIQTITKLAQSAKAIANQALATTDTDAKAAYAAQFDDLLDQIGTVAGDSGYNGTNLLGGNDLTVNFNEDASSSTTITSVDYTDATDSGGLAIANAVNDWDDDANITAAVDDINAALTTLRTQAASFGTSLTVVQARQDFTKNLISTLQEGSAKLTLADTNEESANLLALQTRQSLSVTALSMASQGEQAILRLF